MEDKITTIQIMARFAKKINGIVSKNDRDPKTGRFVKGMIPWDKGIKRKDCYKCKNKTSFSKYHAPPQTKPLGYEVIDKAGFIRVKCANIGGRYKSRWRLKHYIIYEQNHPGVKINSKTHRVIFLDGDNRNFNIDNLELVTLREQLALALKTRNIGGFLSTDEILEFLSDMRK